MIQMYAKKFPGQSLTRSRASSPGNCCSSVHECRDPLHCIIPPYVLEHMAASSNPEVRRIAMETMAASAAMRTMRVTLSLMPMMAAIPSPEAKKHRLVYDMKHKTWPLPGTLVRAEGQGPTGDEAADQAFDFAGDVYDFYKGVLDRNSLDDNGMSLISSVHFDESYNNAFWNGEQMTYGDGDGTCFVSFTKSLDVVGHEMTHGVVTFTSNLKYYGQPGALNEHFADVMGLLVKQWAKKQTVKAAEWVVGTEILGPAVKAKGLRTFKNEKAFENDECLGTDPQPKHMKGLYTGTGDNGGVHINSGIPNHAFYLVATELGGHAWEKAGLIWYKTLLQLTQSSAFIDAAKISYDVAGSTFTPGSMEQKAVKSAWKAVGLDV